jgi:DNA-binding transcriptional ArsR family regulator
MADRDFILAPATETVKVGIALEPAFNVLNSMMLLSHPDERSGFSGWVNQTAAKLPPDVKHRHEMLFTLLMITGIEPTESLPSFPAFIEYVAAQDAEILRDRAIRYVCNPETHGLMPLDKDVLLSDQSAYTAQMEQIFAHKWAEKDIRVEPDMFAEAYALLLDPPALKALYITHLKQMWSEVLQPEWERSLPMLQDSVDAFRQLDYSHLTAHEAIRIVTGRDFRGIWDEWGKELIFIPSPHIGPYVTRFDSDDSSKTWVVFGARLPEGARVSSPALSRSELLVRLSALADDTRLQILELLTMHDELCAPDVIKMLDLSQSAASRHLRQLTATGYLVERRREVAKCYSLNPQRVDDTLRALKRFLRAK